MSLIFSGNPGNTVESTDANGASAVLSGTITYNFTPVPEPASLMLLGVGLNGLGAVLRRKTT